MVFPGRRDGDFNVLSESRQELDQPANGEVSGPVANERRHMGLLDAENSGGLRLREATAFDDAGDLQRQPRFHQFLIRVGQAEIGEYVATAFDDTLSPGSLASCFHGQLCLSL